MSPSAVLLAGAGASLAIVTGLGPIAAAAMGVAAWAARVAGAVGTGPRRQRVDPRAVDEPSTRHCRRGFASRRRLG